MIFDTRKNDIDFPPRLNSLRQAHLSCFYLDEMGDNAYESLGLGIIKLIVENKEKAKESAKNLTTKARQEVSDEAIRRRFIELIESILLNKFSNLSREEVDAMLSVNLIKGTRVYQEIKEEVKEEIKEEVEEKVKTEIVPKLLLLGISVQDIADLLGLDEDVIRKIAEEA